MATLEELENQLRVKRAEQRLENLATDLGNVLKELSEASDVDTAVKVMGRFVARVNNSKAIIRKSQE